MVEFDPLETTDCATATPHMTKCLQLLILKIASIQLSKFS